MDLASVGEFGLIDLIDIPNYAPEQVIVGIGDDCAVLPLNDTHYQLVSCDLLTENVHFLRNGSSPYQLGYKAVAVNLSDVAAMGGKPVHILLSVALPPNYTVEEWQQFYQGVRDICAKYRVNVIGGDTTSSSGKLTINVTVLGMVEQKNLHLRRDAQVGDIVFVTGALGGSRAGLELLLQEDLTVAQADAAHLLQCHCQPEPCCAEIAALNQLAGQAIHALNDISDGLLSECSEIAKASGMALVLQQDAIPVDSACRRLAQQIGADGLSWALTGGEDYQLVGTMAAEQAEELAARYQAQMGKPLYLIGTVEAGSGVYLEQQDKRLPAEQKGYDHFGQAESATEEEAVAEAQSAAEVSAAYVAMLEQQIAELTQQVEAQRIYRHDWQNHLACLAGFLECGKREEAYGYVQQMLQRLPIKQTQQYSQRISLNSLLNQKVHLAQAQQMDVQITCTDGLLDFMSDYDLCTLLGNLLDNGLEHSQCGEEPYLYLDILQAEDGAVQVRLENSCIQPPQMKDGHLASRKADASQHGKGMTQIQHITEQYGGQFRWRYDGAGKRFITECVFL